MLDLVRFLLDGLLLLWPFVIVDEWEHAMLVRRGIITRELGAGIHFRWPLLDRVETYPRVEQVEDLYVAVVETSDNIPFAVSANIAFRMVSLPQNWRAVYDSDESLTRLAIGRIASTIAARPMEALRRDRGVLERNLRSDLNAAVKDWGIKITRVHITDCVRVRALRHYVDGVGG